MNKQGIFMRAMASDATECVISVLGVIGWEVWYQNMRDMLRSIPENIKRVVFEIYSPGGDVWEGNGIIQEIGELSKRCETVARVQMAASMATLIAVACQKRSIAQNGRFLIHNAWAGVTGDAAEMEKMAKSLRDCEQEAARFYAERTGGKAEDMLKLMAEERWMMPDETKALGFVQEISDPFKVEEYEAVKQEIVAAGKWPKALVDIPKAKEDATCPTCKHRFDYAAQPETSMGAVACPACGATVTQADCDTKQNIIKEVKADVLTVTSGASLVPPVTETEPAKPTDELKAEYEKGKVDGIAEGKTQSLIELGDQVVELKNKLADSEKLAAKYQSEKDKLTAQLVAEKESAEKRVKVLRDELDAAAVKLTQFVSGALTFSPAVETWEEAMKASGGDYEKAAKQYPELRKAYNKSKQGGK